MDSGLSNAHEREDQRTSRPQKPDDIRPLCESSIRAGQASIAVARRKKMKLHQHLIYGLIDPRTLLIRYVGLSATGMRRPENRRLPSFKRDNDFTRAWLSELTDLGLRFEIAVLQYSTATSIKSDERWWIAFGRMCEWPLTNLTDGGEGSLNIHPSTREKMSRLAKARVSSAPEAFAAFIRSAHTPETAAKKAASMRLVMTSEHRAKLSSQGKARMANPEERAATAERTRQAWTPERRSKFCTEFWTAERRAEASACFKENNPRRGSSEANAAAISAMQAGYQVFRSNPDNRSAFAKTIRGTWTAERRAAHGARMKENKPQTTSEARASIAERTRQAWTPERRAAQSARMKEKHRLRRTVRR